MRNEINNINEKGNAKQEERRRNHVVSCCSVLQISIVQIDRSSISLNLCLGTNLIDWLKLMVQRLTKWALSDRVGDNSTYPNACRIVSTGCHRGAASHWRRRLGLINGWTSCDACGIATSSSGCSSSSSSSCEIQTELVDFASEKRCRFVGYHKLGTVRYTNHSKHTIW